MRRLNDIGTKKNNKKVPIYDIIFVSIFSLMLKFTIKEFKMPYSEPFSSIINPVDLLTHASFYVETFYNNTLLEKATAFAYQTNNRIYLVSNWHVFSGKINKPNEHGIHQPRINGAIPNKLRVWIYSWVSQDKYTGIGYYFDFNLLDEDEKPLYIEKAYRDNTYIDVALLDVTNYTFKTPDFEKNLGTPFCANTIIKPEFTSNYILHPSDDVYIIGFPFGRLDNSHSAIWKKGSIASDLRHSGHKFFIDTASRDGMSGSPIYRIVNDPLSLLKNNNGNIIENEAAYKIEFIGIYSGRIIEAPETQTDCFRPFVSIPSYDLSSAAQLGIAWKKDVIEFLLK